MQTPELTLAQAVRLVPRLRLAAGAAAAPHGPRGAFRFRLPDPAHRRHEVARRPVGPGAGFHRPACLVRGLSTRRGLGRARPDLGPARGRRPHSAGLHARARRRRADHRRRRQGRGRVRAPHEGASASGKRRASPSPTPRSSGRRSRSSATPSTRSCWRATCASPWAASPPSFRSTIRMARSGTPRPWGPTSAVSPIEVYDRLKQKYAPQGLVALRPGQVVSGRTVAALVAELLLAPRRRAHLAEPRTARRRERRIAASRRAWPALFLAGVAERLGLAPEHIFAAFEDAFYYLWRERQLPVERRSVQIEAQTIRMERARLSKVFEQGLDTVDRPRAARGAR